jgi:ABC-type multidrug transport system permease subunit
MSEHVRHPLVELTRMRFREFTREPEALFWAFAFPVLMACALAVAFRTQAPQPIPIGVLAGEGEAALVATLRGDAGLAVKAIEPGEVDRVLRNGTVHLVVVPGAPPTYRFDPARPETRLARMAADAAIQRAAGRTDVIAPKDDTRVPRGSRYIDWVVPGLLGMNIMGTGMWSIGFSIVFARTRKLLKRLIATPMRRGHYLLSHLCARLVFLALEVGVLLGFSVLVLGTPVNGSLAELAAICLLGAFAFGGLGLLVASRARTIEAVSGLMNVVMLPMWLLSGVFFSSENFPDAMQPIIRVLPLTALNQALRGNLIDGSVLLALWPQVAVLLFWSVVSFVVALRVFRWQ